MPASNPPKAEKVRWFAIRQPLSGGQRALLTALSFALPLGLWCAVSYLPFLWHPEVKLAISADREGVATVYTYGDRLSRDFFPEFAEAVRADNAAILAARNAGEPLESGRRANLRALRHIAAWGLANAYISEAEASDDNSIFALWQRAASGDYGRRLAFSSENIEIVQDNWRRLSATREGLSTRTLPEEALLKLIPQGIPANPVYLPAPHEALIAGWQDFTREPPAGSPSMLDRFGHSLRIVFGGFFLAALIGVPIAVACGAFDFFSRLIEPFIDFFRYLPAPAFSTLLVAIFLAHDAPKIALVFVGTFFQLVLVVANTTRQIDRSLIEASQTLGAKPKDILFRVIAPGILPQLYNDLRILLGWAWTWLVIAELVGVKSGLTEFIETQGRWRNFDRVFPVIFAIGLVGFLTDQLLAWLRIFLFRWTGESPGTFSRLVATSVAAGPRWFQREVLDPRLDPLEGRSRRPRP